MKTKPGLAENENIMKPWRWLRVIKAWTMMTVVHSTVGLRPAELQRADSWHHRRNAVQRLRECYSAHTERLYSKCWTHTHLRRDSVSGYDMCLLTHTHKYTRPTHTHVCVSHNGSAAKVLAEIPPGPKCEVDRIFVIEGWTTSGSLSPCSLRVNSFILSPKTACSH